MRRMLVAATVASLSFASFAGCSQDAPPSPVRTTAACSPANAEVRWGTGVTRAPKVVAAYVLTSAGRGGWQVDFPEVGAQPVWDDSGLAPIASTDGARRAWRKALLASADRTGQVGTRFGSTPVYDIQHPVPLTPKSPSKHRFVGVTMDKWVTMPFTIRCSGASSALTGTVSGAVPGEGTSALYQCGDKPKSALAAGALAYCP